MTEPFDLCGPLPNGTLLLEASAGTGKTYTIAALATRYLAGRICTLDQLLLVTYTRGRPRTARTGSRPAADHRPSAASRRPPEDRSPRCWRRRRGRRHAGRNGSKQLSPPSTPRPSSPRTPSASRYSASWGSRRTWIRSRPSPRISRNSSRRSRPTCTCATTARSSAPAPFTLPTPGDRADGRRRRPTALDVAPGPAEPVDRAQESESEARQRFGEEVRAEVLRRRRVRRTITYDDLIRVAAAVDDPPPVQRSAT